MPAGQLPILLSDLLFAEREARNCDSMQGFLLSPTAGSTSVSRTLKLRSQS